MSELDEDSLVDLHRRIRRARNKDVGVYRRTGSAKVAKKGGRGLARQKNTRNAERAEVFEDALARVSAVLATVAAAQAEQLKAERLAATNPPGTGPVPTNHPRPSRSRVWPPRHPTARPRTLAGRSATPRAAHREPAVRPSATHANRHRGPQAGVGTAASGLIMRDTCSPLR